MHYDCKPLTGCTTTWPNSSAKYFSLNMQSEAGLHQVSLLVLVWCHCTQFCSFSHTFCCSLTDQEWEEHGTDTFLQELCSLHMACSLLSSLHSEAALATSVYHCFISASWSTERQQGESQWVMVFGFSSILTVKIIQMRVQLLLPADIFHLRAPGAITIGELQHVTMHFWSTCNWCLKSSSWTCKTFPKS